MAGLTNELVLIGGGNMARAMIAGLRRSGLAPDCIRVGEPSAAARDELVRDFGITAHADNAAAAIRLRRQ